MRFERRAEVRSALIGPLRICNQAHSRSGEKKGEIDSTWLSSEEVGCQSRALTGAHTFAARGPLTWPCAVLQHSR